MSPAFIPAIALVVSAFSSSPRPVHHVALPQSVSIPDTSSITKESIDKGRRIYQGRGGCAVCHGTKLEGTPVAPAHRKASGWKSAKDGAFEELVRVIAAGVPNTLMLPSPNGISRDDVVLTASYIWAVNHRGEKP